MMIRNRKKLWALFLSATLIVTQLPAVAMAENNAPEDRSIASFEPLDSGMAKQTVDVGTELSELNLPDTVAAEVYHVTEDTVIQDEDNTEDENGEASTVSPNNVGEGVSGSNADDSSEKGCEKTVTTVTTSTEEILVTWDSEPAYDGDRPGKYVFTADVGGYVLSKSAKLPQITVTVTADTVENPTEAPPTEPLPCTKTEGCTLTDGHEGECVTKQPPVNGPLAKTVTGWTFMDDENLNAGELPLTGVNMEQQADFDTVVSMLPTQISVEIDSEAEQAVLDITGWNCPEYKQGDDGNWPLTGEYIFTASLPEGYACASLPAVKVVLPEDSVNLFGLNNTITQGGLTVTGSNGGEVEYTDGSGFTLKKSGTYEISGTWSGTLDNLDWDNLKAVITVPDGVTADITLSDATINMNGTLYACAFVVDGTGTANITLSSTNTLSSGGNRAGLELPENAKVSIDGSGSLTANGGRGAAGIGSGSNSGSSGTIEIKSGTITANGGGGGAGIGGGGTIIISGGTVTAEGGYNGGAGIGGSSDNLGSSGSIIISGGTVTAKGGYNGGAGIGGGYNSHSGSGSGSGGTVQISGTNTTVTTTGGGDGFDVGSGGSGGSGGSLAVSDGATLKMENTGTNVTNPVYVNCTIIDKSGNSKQYPLASPTLTLKVNPENFLTLPGKITLTATLSDAFPDNSKKTITFTVNSVSYSVDTNSAGAAVYSITNPTQGTYTFGASFAGDGQNNTVSATGIIDYGVNLGTQAALTLNGLGSAYTYGCNPFHLSTSGGSGSGAVSYASSDSSVASVTGSTVTILKAGKFTITSTKAADSSYVEATVTSPEVTVIEATPNVSLMATGGSTTSESLILTATVSKAGTGTTPTGTVTFKKENTSLGTVTLDSTGKASYTINSPAAGSYEYTVEYSGQTGYYKGASTTRTIGVGLTNQTGFAITVPGAKIYGDSDFNLTATGGQGTGRVSFSTPQNNGVLTVAAGGTAKITGAGKVTVTAIKDADSIYNQATATLEITVAPRDIANVTVNVTGNRVYTGSQLQPVFEVKDDAFAITTGDYTNSYGANVDTGTGAGSITLIGQRNYTGTKTVNFDIEKRPLTGAAITLESTSYTHTGGEIKPAVTKVVVDGIIVSPAEYDVGYVDNVNEGTAIATITAKAGGNFSGSASATFTITAPSNPPSVDKPSGGDSSSGGSSNSQSEPQSNYTAGGENISRSVSRYDVKWLADSGKSLTLRCDKAGMTFDPAALKAILAAVPSTAGNITFAVAPADLSAFPDAAKLSGTHPVYDFTISYKDSQGNAITVPVNFPAGSAAIALNYTPAAAEVTGSLFMVYVDGKGAVTWLDKSSYDAGKMLAEVPHFSTYGVAYKPPAPVFTDITGHWAKEDIEFVAARGLLSGTGNGLFSPDDTMTRGMFVTALGRLAGINPDSYQTRSFTDVKADAYYAAYVEWAVQKNIVKGTGEGLFSPDAPVTREQMAVMMTNYAGQMGYSIPTPLAAAAFADSDKISVWAAIEVAAMQRAGIIKGKDGNCFDPQASATRAEAAAVLRRFVKIVIDPATATGWVKNDSGHWLYYKGGTAFTGWQIIGKLRYFFNADGVMHEGWKQDTGTNKWYYWTNAGAATGWREIGGKWYYFDENGVMTVNTKVDGYEVGPDGARKEKQE